MIDSLKMLPAGFLYTYIFLFGLCAGSFLNVVILRGLKGEEIVLKGSHCPVCGKFLKWYMNIPLFSYIFLKGKCAFCKAKISIQYPIIELLNALLYIYTFYCFGFTFKTIFLCIIISLFIVLATTDIKEKVILDVHAYCLFLVCILAVKFAGFMDYHIIPALFNSFLLFIAFEYISLMSLSFIGIRCFGFGDSLMLLGIGALFDIKTIPLLLFCSFLIQIVFSIFQILKSKKYKMFFLMLTLLSVLLFDSIVFYLNSSYMKPAFFISLLILIVILFMSIKDISNKGAPVDSENVEQISEKNIFKTILDTVFVFVVLFKKLYKNKKTRLCAFSYLLYLPLLLFLWLYYYKVFATSLIFNIAVWIVVALLFTFVYIISYYEEEAENSLVIFDENEDNETNTDSDENDFGFTMLPYGPALIFSAFLFIFYSDKIQSLFNTMFSHYSDFIINIF